MSGAYPARDFSGFWARRLSRLVSSMPGWRDPTHQDPAERAERRRLAAWIRALYAAPVDSPLVPVDDAVQFIRGAGDQAQHDRREVSSMTASIPVATHRAWGVGLVAETQIGGWPRLDGIEVIADLYTLPPVEWQPGAAAVEDSGDRVIIISRRPWRPVIEEVLISSLSAAGTAIYAQLRTDGWALYTALDAAQLLAGIADS